MDKTITGSEAIVRMRNLKLVPQATFGIKFITCDLNRKTSGEVRMYKECRLRPAPRSERLEIKSDYYLYFTDLETDEPRQCFKVLLREVCFPPSFEWHKIKWFL